MMKIEYRQITVTNADTALLTQLQDAGKEGWALAGLERDTGARPITVTAYLMRPADPMDRPFTERPADTTDDDARKGKPKAETQQDAGAGKGETKPKG